MSSSQNIFNGHCFLPLPLRVEVPKRAGGMGALIPYVHVQKKGWVSKLSESSYLERQKYMLSYLLLILL